MKRAPFTEEQIGYALRRAESGGSMTEICRRPLVSASSGKVAVEPLPVPGDAVRIVRRVDSQYRLEAPGRACAKFVLKTALKTKTHRNQWR